jgi:hypothetical protein
LRFLIAVLIVTVLWVACHGRVRCWSSVVIVDPDEESLKPGSTAAEFYAHIGRIMVLWAEIEGYLFDLFVFAAVIHKYKASIIFEKLKTLQPRLDITNSLLQVTLKEPWLGKWDKVKTQIDQLSELRAHLAHSPTERLTVLSNPVLGKMANQAQPGTRLPTPTGFWYFSATDSRRISKSNHLLISMAQLKAHLSQLKKLKAEISSLGIPRRARKKPPMRQLAPLGLRFRSGTVTAQYPQTEQRKSAEKQKKPPRS